MIKKEFFIERLDGVKLYRSYSDLGYKIKQIETGAIYDEAVDVESSTFTYEETEETIDVSIAEGGIDPQLALNLIFGGQ